ncbi:MAG: hypothetical protein JOZ43_04765, partial [Acidobacteriales bacterium]|nr:hypothetical protein [Terriglobales bacterium]
MKAHKFFAWVVLCLTTAWLVACRGFGTSGTLTNPPPTPTSVTLSATPSTVKAGQQVTLTATGTNATQIVITNNVDNTTQQLPGAGGTVTVTPMKTVTYTATA